MMNITHRYDIEQFTVEVDAYLAYIDYELQNNTMNITHTIVPDAIAGRGIAGKLTEFALNTARANAWKVIPTCSYTSAYIKRHPEYQSLLAD